MIRLNSKDVADLMGKRHDNLMRTIRTDAENYQKETGDDPVRFYEESSYQDGKGQQRACYEISIEGCERLSLKIAEEKREDFLQMCRERGGERPEPVKAVKEPEVKEYTAEEVSKIVGISERSVRRYIQSGKLPAVKRKYTQIMVSERNMVTEDALKAFMKEREGA